MIKHNSEIKLIWRINDISKWGQAFATICVIIKVTYNLTPGDVRRLLVEMAQMGLYVTMTVTLPCIWQKRISAIKLIWCVNDISICGRAYVTIRLVIKVIYILTPGHNRRHLGLLVNMGLYDTLKVTLPCIWQKRVSWIKQIWCVNEISNCGQAYVTIRLIMKVIYIITLGHKRRHPGLVTELVF